MATTPNKTVAGAPPAPPAPPAWFTLVAAAVPALPYCCFLHVTVLLATLPLCAQMGFNP